MNGDLDHGLDARLLLRAAEARRDRLGNGVPVGHDVGVGRSRQGQEDRSASARAIHAVATRRPVTKWRLRTTSRSRRAGLLHGNDRV